MRLLKSKRWLEGWVDNDNVTVRAALGAVLLPPLIGVVIEYRWIDVMVAQKSAYNDDEKCSEYGGIEEHSNYYFGNGGANLFQFAMERGIIDHIKVGLDLTDYVVDHIGDDDMWYYQMSDYFPHIAAYAKNGWHDALELLADWYVSGRPNLSRLILPAIMKHPPGDKKRYVKLLVAAMVLGTDGAWHVDFGETRAAIAMGISSLPKSYRAETAIALDEIVKSHGESYGGAEQNILISLIAELRGGGAD